MADGLTFVLVHGGASSSGFWDLLVPRLSSPTLAVDLPGRAGKPANPMALTVDDCANSVAADVDAAGIGDCVLVAHSSGCYFVPGIAARLAPRVRNEMIGRLPTPELVTVVDLDTGHIPAITDDDEMAEILERAAASVSPSV
jgi:predicted alpha/beta hydrolase family esterase